MITAGIDIGSISTKSAVISLYIIDREVNSLTMACEFENEGLGLISMLDKKEEDCE